MDTCNQQYIEKLAQMVNMGLFDKAKQLIAEMDEKMGTMISQSAESVQMMIHEVQADKARLKIIR